MQSPPFPSTNYLAPRYAFFSIPPLHLRTNEELDILIKHKNVVNYIKAQRLSWFGHVQGILDTRTIKKIFKWNPLTKRSQGRPKYRW